jgi:hypothetical protein
VNEVIRAMPFLWLGVTDVPGPESLRGRIERNSIALLSKLRKPPLDPPSSQWIGYSCAHGDERVTHSGLWNQKHVDEDYVTSFVDNVRLTLGHQMSISLR